METPVTADQAMVSPARRAPVFITPVLVIAGLTFHEAARRKILWTALLLGLAFLALYGYGLHVILREEPTANEFLRRQIAGVATMIGLYAVNFLTVLMTVLTSVDTLAGEISSGVVQSVATKPVRRWEIVIGKWLGFAGMLGLYLLLMAGGVLTITKLLGGYTPPHILRGLGLMWFEGLLLLSLTFLWGTSFSTLTTGVITLGLQGLAFIGGWIEQIGATINRPTAIKVGIVASLVMPSEALWRRAAFEMQSAVINALGVSPFGTASVPSSAMVIYAGMYLAVALSLAVHRFSRRDL